LISSSTGLPNYTVKLRNLQDQINSMWKNPRPTVGKIVFVTDGTFNVYSTNYDASGSILQLNRFVHNDRRNVLYVDGRVESKGLNDLRVCEGDNAAGPYWRVIFSN